MTRFQPLSFGHERAVPVATSGSIGFLGASATRIEVADWRGADRLSFRDRSGRELTLSPNHPVFDLPVGSLPLEQLRVVSGRSTPGSFRDPEIQVRHVCPAQSALPPISADPTWTLSWATVNQLLSEATGGLSLQSAGLQVQGMDWPVFDLRLYRDNSSTSGTLSFEALGMGTLYSFPIERVESGRWVFQHHGPRAMLSGELVEQGSNIELRLLSGRLDSPAGAIDLRPTRLVLGAQNVLQ